MKVMVDILRFTNPLLLDVGLTSAFFEYLKRPKVPKNLFFESKTIILSLEK